MDLKNLKKEMGLIKISIAKGKKQMQTTNKRLVISLILGIISSMAIGETVGVFCNPATPQHTFAAGDIQKALEAKKFTVEIKDLSTLSGSYTGKKVVIALASNAKVIALLAAQGGSAVGSLGQQAYSLRTTAAPQLSYWVLGGDDNGAMYGGLQIAENIKFHSFTGTYNKEESPAILKRGIKLNYPLDKMCPTYGKTNHGGFEGTSYEKAIPHVWDMTFWTTWFDEMARNRYNVVSVWSCHPFTSLIKMADYPDVAVQNVTGFDGFSKTMTMDEKIVFWRQVMAYAHSRGFEFYFFNWNIFTYGATGKYGISNEVDDPETKTYMYTCMKTLLETYPELDGFGITAGENMSENDQANEQWLWDTYGKAVYDYARNNPQRKIRFIHRWHQTTLSEIKHFFAPLFTLPNVTFDMSFKWSIAHMYSTPNPARISAEAKADLKSNALKTWLTVRNDVMYFHNWGDPEYARAYINGMRGLGGDIYRGFYMGSDGFCPTRTFFSKNSVTQELLEIQRLWYMFMLWGRLSYNPATSDDVFKNYMALKYQGVSSDDLFAAWSKVSSCIPKITELIQGTWTIDFAWWLEGCSAKGGFKTAEQFSKCKVAEGSSLGSIAQSASNSCGGKKSSYQLADEIETDAMSALTIVNGMSAPANTELGVAINNIKAMSCMSIYYAYKIRGATYIKAEKMEDAKTALGKAYCWWMKYANLMDSMYTGMDMQRNADIPDWHARDQAVLKEYTDLGGAGKSSCEIITQQR
jgi:hypothetical protein